MFGTLYVKSPDVPCVFGVVHPHLLLECFIFSPFSTKFPEARDKEVGEDTPF